MVASAAKGLWGWYQQQLARYPLRTQVISSGILWASGDFLAQKVDAMAVSRSGKSGTHISKQPRQNKEAAQITGEDMSIHANRVPGMDMKICEKDISHENQLNRQRIFTTGLFGICFVGPIGHFWYEGLEYFVSRRLHLRPNTVKFIAAKVIADTAVFGPLHLVAFFAWTGLASGKQWEQVQKDVLRDFVPAFMTEGTVWPIVQIANFKYVPVRHQLLFVNSVCLFDSTWLSWLKHQEDAPWKQFFMSIFRRSEK